MKSEWLKMADECMHAATQLADVCPRSATSRAYYAAFSAAQSILLHYALDAPNRGNWPHGGLGQAVSETLGRGQPSPKKRDALTVRDSINQCYNMRIQADYNPERSMSADDARQSIKRARSIARLAMEVVK